MLDQTPCRTTQCGTKHVASKQYVPLPTFKSCIDTFESCPTPWHIHEWVSIIVVFESKHAYTIRVKKGTSWVPEYISISVKGKGQRGCLWHLRISQCCWWAPVDNYSFNNEVNASLVNRVNYERLKVMLSWCVALFRFQSKVYRRKTNCSTHTEKLVW